MKHTAQTHQSPIDGCFSFLPLIPVFWRAIWGNKSKEKDTGSLARSQKTDAVLLTNCFLETGVPRLKESGALQ